MGMFTQWEGNVLKHAHVSKQGAELKQHAHAAPDGIELFLIHGADILPIKQHLPRPGTTLTAHQTQRRRLAAAHRTDECRDLAPGYAQRNVIQNRALPVTKTQVSQFNQRWGGGMWHKYSNRTAPGTQCIGNFTSAARLTLCRT